MLTDTASLKALSDVLRQSSRILTAFSRPGHPSVTTPLQLGPKSCDPAYRHQTSCIYRYSTSIFAAAVLMTWGWSNCGADDRVSLAVAPFQVSNSLLQEASPQTLNDLLTDAGRDDRTFRLVLPDAYLDQVIRRYRSELQAGGPIDAGRLGDTDLGRIGAKRLLLPSLSRFGSTWVMTCTLVNMERLEGRVVKVDADGPADVVRALVTQLWRELHCPVRAWRFSAGSPIVTRPVVRDKLLVVGSADGTWFGLDTITGNILWNYRIQDGIKYVGDWIGEDRAAFAFDDLSSAAIGTDAAFLGSLKNGIAIVDVKTGKLIKSIPVDAWSVTNLIVKDNRLFCLGEKLVPNSELGNKKNIRPIYMCCYTMVNDTWVLAWSKRPPNESDDKLYAPLNSPDMRPTFTLFDKGLEYHRGPGGGDLRKVEMTMFESESGDVRWSKVGRLLVPVTESFGLHIESTAPSPSWGPSYLGHVERINPTDGSTIWRATLGRGYEHVWILPRTDIVILGGNNYNSNVNGPFITAVNQFSKEPMWEYPSDKKWPTGEGEFDSVVGVGIYGTEVIVRTNTGFMCIDIESGVVAWKVPYKAIFAGLKNQGGVRGPIHEGKAYYFTSADGVVTCYLQGD